MKEMVGGCCVCSDDSGWAENPLVYCDGQGCNVAVHQACYGIVHVPIGNWFCRKCESGEKPNKVRCELCPYKDGALKRTDNNGWAHVVCALYIPEVRFGNVSTMEPILLEEIPQERFSKSCYICEDSGHKSNRSRAGACMMCNKTGCRQQFHVTCAQMLGLLCEEAGSYMDNVKYCGYCSHHYSKLVRKGANIKPIPPYRPAQNSSSSETPEKEVPPSSASSSSQQSTQSSTVNMSELWSNKQQQQQQQQPKRKKSNDTTSSIDNNENALNLLSLSTAPSPAASGSALHDSKFTSETFVDCTDIDAKNRKRRGGIEEKFNNNDSKKVKNDLTAPDKETYTDSSTNTSSVLMTNPARSQASSYNQNGNNSIVVSVPLSTLPISDGFKPRPSPTPKVATSSSDRPSPISSPDESQSSANNKTKTATSTATQNSAQAAASTNTSPAVTPMDENLPSTSTTTSNMFQDAGAPLIMLGNQLNPNSTMAQKMSECLSSELEAHSVYTSEPNLNASLVGPQLPNKVLASARNNSDNATTGSTASSTLSLSNNSNNIPQRLEELLERQWEQGSQFMMEQAQAQHLDIASLLTCLHKLRSENVALEDQKARLEQKRNQLLAVNARLAIPLTPITPINNNTMPSQTPVQVQPQQTPVQSQAPTQVVQQQQAPPQAAPQQQSAPQQQRSTILHTSPVNTMVPPTSNARSTNMPERQQQHAANIENGSSGSGMENGKWSAHNNNMSRQQQQQQQHIPSSSHNYQYNMNSRPTHDPKSGSMGGPGPMMHNMFNSSNCLIRMNRNDTHHQMQSHPHSKQN